MNKKLRQNLNGIVLWSILISAGCASQTYISKEELNYDEFKEETTTLAYITPNVKTKIDNKLFKFKPDDDFIQRTKFYWEMEQINKEAINKNEIENPKQKMREAEVLFGTVLLGKIKNGTNGVPILGFLTGSLYDTSKFFTEKDVSEYFNYWGINATNTKFQTSARGLERLTLGLKVTGPIRITKTYRLEWELEAVAGTYIDLKDTNKNINSRDAFTSKNGLSEALIFSVKCDF